MSVISMKQLLEAGVHFGHQTRKWNPKMKKYIFTSRNDIHIINLEDTVKLAEIAYNFVRGVVKEGRTVLFVGTKKQASEVIEQEAKRCGMFYINSRWLGGTLTNFKTIRSSVEKMKKIENMEKTGEFDLLPKNEVLLLKQEHEKLKKNLDGIRDMTSLPGVMFIIDSKKEQIAIKEARVMGIPLVGLIDTNCNPEDVDYCIPGNDDAIRAIKLIAGSMADAVIEAKEGVEIDRSHLDDEVIDIAKALEDVDVNELIRSDIEEDDSKKTKKKKPVRFEKPFVKQEVKPVVKPEVKAEIKQDVKAEVKPVIKEEVKAEVKPVAKEEVKPVVKPEVKAEVKPVAKEEVKPEVKAEAKPVAKEEVKPEAKQEVKPVIKPEVKAEAKPKVAVVKEGVKTEEKPKKTAVKKAKPAEEKPAEEK